jgi:myo-inositol-1-phosphate synthase
MSKKVKVALAGIGNCSSSLVQGVEYYGNAKSGLRGLNYPTIGGYSVQDLDFVAAFDIDRRKVGHDLSEAIFAEPNNVRKIAQPRPFGVQVKMSQPLDGISPIAGNKIEPSDSKAANVVDVLKSSKADVLVNLVPTGASKASEMYADAAWKAGCGFVNATPAKVASKPVWRAKYKKRVLPLIGDDIMDQIGSTILHKNLLSMLNDRGMHFDETYQLDIGGGTESEIALDKKRYEIKRAIKTAAVAATVPYTFPIVAGSSDFVDFMENRRTSYFWIRGEYFAGTEFTMDLRLSLEDGPACAGVLVDVIRMMKVAVENRQYELLPTVCAYGFKAPPKRLDAAAVNTSVEKLVGHKKTTWSDETSSRRK